MAYRDGQRLPLDEAGGSPGSGPTLRLSVNPRARRLSVRIDARAGEAVVIAPTERTLPQAVAFARTRAVWIAERLAVQPKGRPLEPGQVISLRGRRVQLEATPGAGAARLVEDGAVIRSGGEGEAYARRIENLLKREARQTLVERTDFHLRTLVERTDFHLRTLGQKPVKVSIADTKSRWGSCSPHNRTIRYSWRIIMAPPPVIDYLAAHEVAHLVHADHSPAYWAVVERLIGDHRPYRKWLRDHGGALHAVGR